MNKKVYFAGSIRAGRNDSDIYNELIQYIQTKATVLTEHIGSPSLTSMGEQNTPEEFIHDRDMEWVMESDFIIAEVTSPSLGVGYEIGRAIENEIPVFALFRPSNDKKLSAMISGSNGVKLYEYSNIKEAKEIIDQIFDLMKLNNKL